MSSSELSDDEYHCTDYSIDWYSPGPPLISKRARILAAASQNDLETLKQLLDSPKWYKVRDMDGNNLLHIAILRHVESYDVFDYLLSLHDFPLDEVNKSGDTALGRALSYLCFWAPVSDCEHFVIELIKKGANIDIECDTGDTPLHFAVKNELPEVARSLIERGADINILDHQGSTPLHCCVCIDHIDVKIKIEMITMLLCYGAAICDTSNLIALNCFFPCVYYTLDCSVLVALENLFYFTVDQWCSYKIVAEGLLCLAQIKSPLFDQMVKYTSESSVIVGEYEYPYWLCLFTIDVEYLRILLEKYPNVVKECLQSYSNYLLHFTSFDKFNLENFEMLRHSLLWSDTVELILILNSIHYKYCNRTTVISCILYQFLNSGKKIDEFFELIYYLLSYGMILNEIDLQYIYKETGYSEDFKNLLFMDINKQNDEQITDMMPRLIYDFKLDIHKIVESPSLCEFIDWEKIFHYFAHPKIQNAFHQLEPNNKIIVKQLPQVPLLQELARDTFRKYFVKELKIKTAKQFYTLLRSLKISHVHEKIITYETELY